MVTAATLSLQSAISKPGRLLAAALIVIVLPAALRADDAASTPTTEQLAFFAERIEPLLTQRCLKCHSGDEPKGGLNLTTREALLTGGDSGPALDPANPAGGLLLSAIRFEGPEMPPTGKLPAAEIELFTKWIEMGAPMNPITVASSTHAGPPEINDETRNHWSFRPLTRPPVPTVQNAAWVSNPIDAFILAKLEAAELAPSPPAAPRELYRRLHYDLLGLPPSVANVEYFAANPTPQAWQKSINRLLDSPQYGEHWARHWLDLVRYGESNSYERDNPKPFVWRYRDYVIDAFNSDKPFDQFTREQLAGDELNPPTPETIIATGYYRLGLWDDEPVDKELAFYDGLDDIAATTAQAFLGLTMNCARCHAHKIDPIPHEDYYRFLAFFRNVRHYGVRADPTVFEASVCDIATPEQRADYQARKSEFDARVSALRQQLDAIEEPVRAQLQGGEIDDFKNESVRPDILKKHVGEFLTQARFDDYMRLHAEWKDLREHPPAGLEQALCVKENGAECPPTFVLARGNPAAQTAEVQPGFPQVLSAPDPEIVPVGSTSSGRRLALAKWIASPQNPLTARVAVNRIWQWHFGRGLVRSSNNFGLQGDRPTHPELLDWLAVEFIEQGWSIKQLSRLILASNTYQMSSHPGHTSSAEGGMPPDQGDTPLSAAKGVAERAMALDPQNNLYWRFDSRRLRAEELRDSILAVNGSLNLESMHGPSIYEVIPQEVLAGQSRPGENWGVSSAEDRRRRTIYIHVKRSLQVPLLAAFDAADADTTCPVRFSTTQPTQALTLLNSDYLGEQAAAFAAAVKQQAGDNLREQVACALQRGTQRPPTASEIDRGCDLVESLQSARGLSADQSLAYYCLLVLNLNEFAYVD